jgi:hypothetical protein
MGVTALTDSEINAFPLRIPYGGPVTIGGQSKTDLESKRFFGGALAEFNVYDSALTLDELEALECQLSGTYNIEVDHCRRP